MITLFRIERIRENGLDFVKIFNAETGEHLSIVPEFGANVNSLVLWHDGKLYSVLEGNSRREDFQGNRVFRGAKLLPFPNRIKEGKFFFRNKLYHLPRNYTWEGNAAHGFVYDKPFRLVERNTSEEWGEVLFSYEYSGDYPGYPFPFTVHIHYRLQRETGFVCETRVRNGGEEEMPLGDGWHPFFTFGDSVNQLLLRFPARKQILLNHKLIPTGEKREFKDYQEFTPFGDRHFDSCFLLNDQAERQRIELRHQQEDLTIVLWQEVGPGKYNYLQIYTPPERTSVALEPMTCNVDAFNNGEGLIILKPGDEFRARYGVQLK